MYDCPVIQPGVAITSATSGGRSSLLSDPSAASDKGAPVAGGGGGGGGGGSGGGVMSKTACIVAMTPLMKPPVACTRPLGLPVEPDVAAMKIG